MTFYRSAAQLARESPRGSPTRLKQISLAYLFLLPSLAILAVFVFYPIAQALRLSFFEYEPLVQAEPYFVRFQNFVEMWHDDAFWTSLTNTFKYLLVVPVIIVLSLALSLLVERRLPGTNFFRACYYMPVVTSMVVVGIMWRFLFNEDHGLINQMLLRSRIIREPIHWFTDVNLVLFTVMTVTVWKGLGYYMVVFIAGLRSIPEEMVEAAGIDGARPWQTLVFVKLPLLWPSITLVAIISSISALQVFEEIFIMTHGKPLNASSTLVFHIYQTGLDTAGAMRMGYACAMGMVLFVILGVFTAFMMKAMHRFGYQAE